MNSPLLEKSMDFATQIVLFYEEFSKSKKDTTIAKQLLRSATSVGANINEAIYGNSKADFISKLHISLKETGESIYWLTLLKRTNLIVFDFDTLIYSLVCARQSFLKDPPKDYYEEYTQKVIGRAYFIVINKIDELDGTNERLLKYYRENIEKH